VRCEDRCGCVRCGGGGDGGVRAARDRCGAFREVLARAASLVARDTTAGPACPPSRTTAGTACPPSRTVAGACAGASADVLARFFFPLLVETARGGGVLDLIADASSRSNAVRGAPAPRGAGPRHISHVTLDGGLLNVHAPHDHGGAAAAPPPPAEPAAGRAFAMLPSISSELDQCLCRPCRLTATGGDRAASACSACFSTRCRCRCKGAFALSALTRLWRVGRSPLPPRTCGAQQTTRVMLRSRLCRHG
jgi:hypothetical protein